MKIGFIGGGNMASAIIGGMIEKKVYANDQVMASGKDAASLDNLHSKYGIEVTEDNAIVMDWADVLFLSVKPQVLPQVIAEISPMAKEGQLFISIAAGKTIGWIEEQFGKEIKLVKKEFDILLYFMQRPSHVVDKGVLAESVWGDYADDADNFQFVYAQIKNLRRKLESAEATIEIGAVYGFGYKLTIN